MLSDEEKKAIKVINKRTERLIEELKIEEEDLIDEPKIAYLITQIEANKTLLNLIEKQSKEIEELKQIKCKLDEKNIPIETLLAEFERLEDLEDDLTTVYLNGVYDGEKKVQDKIKAKIEELKQQIEKEEKETMGRCITIGKSETILILQSLLEKE